MQTPTKATAHSVYNLNYHIVFVIATESWQEPLNSISKDQMPILCERYGWEQLPIEVMPDHVHLFVSAPPTTAPVTIAQTLKSILALSLFKTFPTLKQQRPSENQTG